jgi:hypothetical protein
VAEQEIDRSNFGNLIIAFFGQTSLPGPVNGATDRENFRVAQGERLPVSEEQNVGGGKGGPESGGIVIAANGPKPHVPEFSQDPSKVGKFCGIVFRFKGKVANAKESDVVQVVKFDGREEFPELPVQIANDAEAVCHFGQGKLWKKNQNLWAVTSSGWTSLHFWPERADFRTLISSMHCTIDRSSASSRFVTAPLRSDRRELRACFGVG